jgi:hypothetical protein
LTLVIGHEWNILFANNPKLHAFAVAKEGKVIWQTDNWDLVDEIENILKAADKDEKKLTTGGVTYERVTSTDDSYIASSDGKGHLILVLIDEHSWAIAFAAPTAVPELAIIDVRKTVIQIRGHV